MWSLILTDKNYVPVGEILNASDRRVAKPLSKIDTASFRVRLDNPLADPLLSCKGYVKAYRDGVLQFFGPVLSAEEVGDSMNASISVNCASVGWFLQKRLAGKSATGQVYSSSTDRAAIAADLITLANAETYGETGIQIGTVASGSAISGYAAGPYKPILEVINELALAFDGFDWKITPIDNWSGGAVTSAKIGEFTADEALGATRPGAIFEWGTGRNNIMSYTRSRNREGQANKVYHAVSQGPDVPGYPVVSAIDTGSISDYKLLEDLAAADLIDSSFRQQFVDEHVFVRRYPRETIVFEPHIDPMQTGRLPVYGADYDIGDIVRARAVYHGTLRFDYWIRVYAVEFNINDLGVEKATLTLTMDN